MAAFKALFGDTLTTKEGEKPTETVLSGKSAVGVYFSAHWCPPCRGFTPQLASMYKDAFQAKGMEIVFVSSDRDEGSFKDYYGEMPWVAMPYAKRTEKDALSKKFKVQGIPTFIILGPDGSVINKDGREAVASDPKGERYPWAPPTAADKAKELKGLLGDELVSKCAGKHVGLYFSAHWCPPCRGFTPTLAKNYKDGLKDKMEIIFVSSDRDECSFKEYFGEMPWLALPYEKRCEKEKLSQICGVQGIPMFVVFSPDFVEITKEGRSKVCSDPTGAKLPEAWLPQPINDVNDDPSDINEEKCVVAVGSDSALNAAVEALARKFHEQAGKNIEEMPVRFFLAPDGDITKKITDLLKVSGNKLVVTDFPSGGAYYVCDKAVTDAAGVEAFLADVDAGKVEKKTVG